MKKLLALFVALFVVSSVTYAEEVKYGARAGVNIANLVGADAVTEGMDKASRIGIVGGGFVTVPLSDQFSLQAELLFSMKGAKHEGTYRVPIDFDPVTGQPTAFQDTKFEMTTNLTYIEIPVLAKLNIPTEGSVKPNLYLGPSIGIKMGAEAEAKFNGQSVKMDLEDINSLDLGLALGGGIGIEAGEGEVTLDVRYTMGLASIDGSPAKTDIKNSVISIMAGYRF